MAAQREALPIEGPGVLIGTLAAGQFSEIVEHVGQPRQVAQRLVAVAAFQIISPGFGVGLPFDGEIAQGAVAVGLARPICQQFADPKPFRGVSIHRGVVPLPDGNGHYCG